MHAIVPLASKMSDGITPAIGASLDCFIVRCQRRRCLRPGHFVVPLNR